MATSDETERASARTAAAHDAKSDGLCKLSATHCDGYAFLDGRKTPRRMRGTRCVACGGMLDKWSTTIEPFPFKKRYDVSYTYDGVLVVSERFRVLYERCNWTGLSFVPVPRRDGFHVASLTDPPLRFPPTQPRREGPCRKCRRFEAVVVNGPARVIGNRRTFQGRFFRTDEEFGSLCKWTDGAVHDERSPLVLCGSDVAETIRLGKLTGWLHFEPAQVIRR